MKKVENIIREISRNWSDLNKVEIDLKVSRDLLRKSDMNSNTWELYDMIVVQLDMLNSPDYKDFDGRVFTSIINIISKG